MFSEWLFCNSPLKLKKTLKSFRDSPSIGPEAWLSGSFGLQVDSNPTRIYSSRVPQWTANILFFSFTPRCRLPTHHGLGASSAIAAFAAVVTAVVSIAFVVVTVSLAFLVVFVCWSVVVVVVIVVSSCYCGVATVGALPSRCRCCYFSCCWCSRRFWLYNKVCSLL